MQPNFQNLPTFVSQLNENSQSLRENNGDRNLINFLENDLEINT